MNARAFTREIDLPGWSGQSIWGYDELLECYWANLWRDEDRFDAPRIAISAYHLIPTPNALASRRSSRRFSRRTSASSSAPPPKAPPRSS